jgi:hypothetical protein
MTNLFLSQSNRPEDYWRSIVLYGRNVASYKFALAAALLELRPQSGELVKLEDLAPVYALQIARHIKNSPKQATAQSSNFLDACSKYNSDNDLNALINSTLKGGFNNVIDAFHNVGSGPISLAFFTDERVANRGIRLTDHFSKMLSSPQVGNLPHEVEARWNLVETAWELGLASSMLTIQHDQSNEDLIAYSGSQRRKSVTSSRSALNGYQRGECFYCKTAISIHSPITADVDHFFPHVLKIAGGFDQVDQIWNLVLSCRDCNRGENGKFMNIPSPELVEKIHLRNEYYISSHHPLRETLIKQIGSTEPDRRSFLGSFYKRAQQQLPGQIWQPQHRRRIEDQ